MVTEASTGCSHSESEQSENKKKPGWNWGALALMRAGGVAVKKPEGEREE